MVTNPVHEGEIKMSWKDIVKGKKPKKDRKIKSECDRCGGIFRDYGAEEDRKRSKEDIMFDVPLGQSEFCSGCEKEE